MKNVLKSPAIICALGAIAVAIMGLLGYLPGMGLIGSINENYIPMAPSTAVSFLVLGFILLILNLKQLSGTKTIIPLIATLLVSLFGILEVAGYFSGIDLNFEDTLVPTAGHLNGVPIARMSPATGAAFFLSGVVAFFLILQRNFLKRNTPIQYFAGGLAILVLLISFVFCLAYLYGTPLLYGHRTTIPMALTTALGFMFLSISILTSEMDTFPLRLLTGTSTLSYLLRFILPLSTFSVILGGLTVLSSGQTAKMNPAFISAALIVLIAMVTGFVATLISRHMGGEIDRSKAAVKQANEALRESEARFRSVYDQSPIGIELYDSKGNLIDANPKCLNMFGIRDVAAVRGFKLFENLNISDEVKKKILAGEALSYESEFDFDKVRELNLYETNNTGKMFVNVSVTPWKTGGPDEDNFLIHVMDTTERKRAEDTLQLRAAMMDNMAEGGYLIGLDDLLIKWANDKFAKMFGYDPGEMVGKHVDIVIAPSGRTPSETRISIVDVIKETREWHGEVRTIKRDGTHFWCSANVSLFEHPEYGKVMVSVHTDITDRKKAEEKLEKHREHLEKLVKERTSELKEKNTDLERMNDLFVGREFRIKELRDRVKELEES